MSHLNGFGKEKKKTAKKNIHLSFLKICFEGSNFKLSHNVNIGFWLSQGENMSTLSGGENACIYDSFFSQKSLVLFLIKYCIMIFFLVNCNNILKILEGKNQEERTER